MFKKSIIIFWCLWWITALWTDVVGTLNHYGLLLAAWAPDLNFPFLQKSLAMYNVPHWVPDILMFCIISWMIIIVTLFLKAALALSQPKTHWMPKAEAAFIVSLLFWFAFFLADQMIMNFTLEENHMVQGGFELLCFLALYILPDS